jgi:hypothetical protein
MNTKRRKKLTAPEEARLKTQWLKNISSQMRYCGQGLPRHPAADGFFLVHNSITPTRALGLRGFRAWVQEGGSDLLRCQCDFGGLRHAELHEHYRVRHNPILPWLRT